MKTEIVLVTSNPDKAAEAARILGSTVQSHKVEVPEIQSFSLEEIVRAKVEAAYAILQKPVLVDDVAMDVAALGGFPGPFVKFWQAHVGYDQAVVLAKSVQNMTAIIRCGVGYYDGKQCIYTEGIVPGVITDRRGEEGFGFDFYFIPDGSNQTFAEMGYAGKDQVSHRKRGFELIKAELKKAGLL